LKNNNIEIVKYLLEETDTPVDVSTSNGTTALLIAVDDCSESLIHLLRHHGANCNASYTIPGVNHHPKGTFAPSP
jgi:ankyrin repeat protein